MSIMVLHLVPVLGVKSGKAKQKNMCVSGLMKF